MMLRRMLLNLTILTLVSGALSAQLAADNEPLVVDLLPERVEVDSSFTGSTVILFGVKTQPGDIIVTLRGPEAPVVVRRKRRVAGIWVNRDSVAFRDVPQYYAMATSRPIDESMEAKALDRNQIGTGHILLNTIWTRTADEVDSFREAVRRTRAEEGLYALEIGEIVANLGVTPDGRTAYVGGVESVVLDLIQQIFIVDLENREKIGSLRGFELPADLKPRAEKPAFPLMDFPEIILF